MTSPDCHGKQTLASDNIHEVLQHSYTPWLVNHPGDFQERMARHHPAKLGSKLNQTSEFKDRGVFSKGKIFKNFHTKTSQLRENKAKKGRDESNNN